MGAPREGQGFLGEVGTGLDVHTESQTCTGMWAEQWFINPKPGFAIHCVARAQARDPYTS